MLRIHLQSAAAAAAELRAVTSPMGTSPALHSVDAQWQRQDVKAASS